ncbi:MAG TPA: cytochrome P450 [Sporichthyaceae bacterium]
MTDISRERPYDEIDLSSRKFWAQPAAVREESFATLREQRPLSWHPPVEDALLVDEDDPGFWTVVRHADIVEVSRRHDVFVSGQGVIFENAPEMLLETSQSFLATDPPRHTKLRKLVSAAFTPRQISRISEQIEGRAKQAVARLAAAGSGADFVRECAGPLPQWVFCDMVGVGEQEREEVAEAAAALVSWADPIYLGDRDPLDVMFEAQLVLLRHALALAEDRRSKPTGDLMSALVAAEVGGETLLDEEIGAFFTLLSVAANDTTRQTMSHAVHALTKYPEQRAWLAADFDARIDHAIEEFVRWATPVMTFRRTAVADVEVHGITVHEGEKVVMMYPSGNWDTDVFTDPAAFDLSRHPNPHVSFGGGGVHFCLGAQLARTQLRAVFRELFSQLPDLAAGDPDYLTGNFIHVVRTLPVTF